MYSNIVILLLKYDVHIHDCCGGKPDRRMEGVIKCSSWFLAHTISLISACLKNFFVWPNICLYILKSRITPEIASNIHIVMIIPIYEMIVCFEVDHRSFRTSNDRK